MRGRLLADWLRVVGRPLLHAHLRVAAAVGALRGSVAAAAAAAAVRSTDVLVPDRAVGHVCLGGRRGHLFQSGRLHRRRRGALHLVDVEPGVRQPTRPARLHRHLDRLGSVLQPAGLGQGVWHRHLVDVVLRVPLRCRHVAVATAGTAIATSARGGGASTAIACIAIAYIAAAKTSIAAAKPSFTPPAAVFTARPGPASSAHCYWPSDLSISKGGSCRRCSDGFSAAKLLLHCSGLRPHATPC